MTQESINYAGGNDRRTTFTDRDGDHISVERITGEPDLEGTHVYVCGDGAYVPVKEFIAAIEKAAAAESTEAERLAPIEPSTSVVTDAFAPLWAEVEYHPARAVKVTPELVRALADNGSAEADLAPLEAAFSPTTGEPVGVGYYNPMTFGTTFVPLGKRVILRTGQRPQVLNEDEFEKTYREVQA